jgi:hypothetical protein
MSEFCIEHMWYGEQACPHCHQPADEPCPSSCGVDLAYFAPVGSNPPKADAVSDAAHMYWDAYGSPQSRQEREAYYSQHGLVLRTREEWECQRGELTVWRDKYDRVIDQLTDLRQGDMEAELATLRAQLADAEKARDQALSDMRIFKSSYTRCFDELDPLRLENERLRKDLHDALASNPSRRAGGNPGDAAAVVDDRVGGQDVGRALLRVAGSEGKFGRGDAGEDR